jgi:hypothetical protein
MSAQRPDHDPNSGAKPGAIAPCCALTSAAFCGRPSRRSWRRAAGIALLSAQAVKKVRRERSVLHACIARASWVHDAAPRC